MAAGFFGKLLPIAGHLLKTVAPAAQKVFSGLAKGGGPLKIIGQLGETATGLVNNLVNNNGN